MNVHEVLPLFSNIKQISNGYTAQCPVCGDSHHLYITPKDEKVLFYCQKCQAGFGEIAKIVEFPKSKDEPAKIVEKYDHIYKNTDGSIAYCKQRVKYSDGKKKFIFHYVEDGEKVFKKPKFCNNLYNLDLLESASSDTVLYIVEGEKCADIMVKNGFLATTTNTGAGSKISLSGTDLRMLEKFKNKVAIPDNDDVGIKYCDNFQGARVLFLKDIWQDIRPKQDIFDYITKDYDLEKIRNYTFEEVREFEELTKEDLISPKLFDRLLAIKDSFEHTQAVTRCTSRARELKAVNDFNANFKQYKISLALKNANSNGRKTKFSGQPIKLNCGDWIADDFGVKRNEISNSDGNIKVKLASPIPILPIEILYNEEERTEKLNIAFFKNNWKNVICERSKIANSSKIIELADKGVEVNSDNSKLLVSYIAECVSKNLDTLPRLIAVSRLGWFDGDFIPYHDGLRFDGEEEHSHLYNAIATNGDYNLWIEQTRELRQNIYIRLLMATSFASILVEKLGISTFVLHLWGDTGSGKTVALMVAMSIWGNPALGKLVKTMNMTVNSMMSTCGFLHNLPFAGDELQTIKNKYTDYDSTIMKITEGIDRGRMQYDKVKAIKTWANTILFTGEEPCTKSYSGGGVKNRVIEIEVTSDIVENGNEVATFVKENYGHAGKDFVEQVKNRETLRDEFQEIHTQISSNCNTSDKQAVSMACILLADKISSEHIFNTEPLQIADVEPFLLSANDIDLATRAYDFVINLIARHAIKFASPEYNYGECWGRTTGDYTLINKDVLVSEMAKENMSFDSVKKKWVNKGWLIKNSQGRLVHNTKCSGAKGLYIKILNKAQEDIDFSDFDEDLAF